MGKPVVLPDPELVEGLPLEELDPEVDVPLDEPVPVIPLDVIEPEEKPDVTVEEVTVPDVRLEEPVRVEDLVPVAEFDELPNVILVELVPDCEPVPEVVVVSVGLGKTEEVPEEVVLDGNIVEEVF